MALELKDFDSNTYVLTGVDTAQISKDVYGDKTIFEHASVINFILNGVVYSAIEDPEDGYRSSMDEIKVVTDVVVRNTFLPCQVIAKMQNGDDGVIEFIDAKNGMTVLEIGTSHAVDYYPCFVGNFIPENMSANREKEIEERKQAERKLEQERELLGWASW